jgi:hypothetical protein
MKYTPTTRPVTVQQPCRKSCCWTPYVCAKNRACDCHKDES